MKSLVSHLETFHFDSLPITGHYNKAESFILVSVEHYIFTHKGKLDFRACQARFSGMFRGFRVFNLNFIFSLSKLQNCQKKNRKKLNFIYHTCRVGMISLHGRSVSEILSVRPVGLRKLGLRIFSFPSKR